MRIRVIYHDRCFDGAASAALLSRFLQDYYYCDGVFAFQGVLHTPGFLWDSISFDGDENVIVDFRYSRDPRVTWWFDHHQSAFLSPEDELHFQAANSRHKVLDSSCSSCTSLIADYLKREFAYVAAELEELVHWADIIDGAKYPTPEAAVDLLSPASRLKLVIENAKDPAVRNLIVRKMRYRSMEEILEDPVIAPLEHGLADDQLALIDILLEKCERHGRIAVIDLTGTDVERHNKLMPYLMFADVDYALAILRMGDLVKVSLGTNPWSKTAPLANLATVAERYGGGGHSAVAGITLGPGQLPRARRIVEEVIDQLSMEKTTDRTNGHRPGGLRAKAPVR
ncbi:MAG: phosphoesterase [Acidobacteria bacterium]|nr:phosphoesterase [Acidobacteriota bacterium]